MKFSLVLLVCVFRVVNSEFFPVQKEIIYDYEALIRVIADSSELYTSEFLINAKLYATGTKNGVLVELKDLMHTVYAGKDDKLHESNKIGLHSDSEMIMTPFLIKYNSNGLVSEILTNKSDNLWSINMKKGIASMLQLDLTQLDTKHTDSYRFVSDEETVHGKCKVQYSVVPENPGVFKVFKHNNIFSCQEFKFDTNIDLLSSYCEDPRSEILTTTSERFYDVEFTQSHININHIEGFNRIVFNPFNTHGSEQSVFVNQVIHKLSEKMVNETEYINENDVINHRLKNDIVDKDLVKESYDISGGRQIISQDTVMRKARESLNTIIRYITKNQINLSENIENQKLNMNFLIHQIKHMDRTTLESFYKSLSEITSDDGKIMFELFLHALPFAGSYSSALFIEDLIKTFRVKNEIAMEMLMNMPFYVRHLDKDLLHEFYGLIKENVQISSEVKNTAKLAFATMVNLAARKYGENDEDVKHYVDFYFKKLYATRDEKVQAVYINALKNIEVNYVFQQLELVMKNQTTDVHNITPHLITLAMWATRQKYVQYPGRVNVVYWPMMVNQKENLEVRTTALRILLLSASMNDHMKLYWYMQSVKDTELYNNYYATLYEMSKVTGTCYAVSTHLAKNMLQIVKKPTDPSIEQTLNFSKLSEIFDAFFGYGLLSHVTTMGNLATRGFLSVYVAQTPQVDDSRPVKQAFYIYIKISDTLKRILQSQGSGGVEDVVKFMGSLKPEDFRIEIARMKHDRIVSFVHYDFETLHTALQKLKDRRDRNSGITNFFVDQINGGEILIPTDIGVPVSLFLQMPTLRMSNIQFDRKYSDDKKTASIKFTYDNVWWYQDRTGVAIYNPIANLWHGTRKVYNLDVHVPIDIETSFSMNHRVLKMGLNENTEMHQRRRGFQSHVHNHVFLFDDNDVSEVGKMCTTCRPVTIVSQTQGTNNLKKLVLSEKTDGDTQYQYALFNCERKLSDMGISHLKGKFTKDQENKLNLNIMSVIKQWRIFDWISRDPGMCGIGLTYSMHGNDGIGNDNQVTYKPDLEYFPENLHYREKDQLFCEIGKDYIIDSHHSRMKNEVNNEWKLYAGNCDQSCKWSISVKKVEGGLAIQLKKQDDTVEIYPQNGYQVKLNGDKLAHLTTGYYKGSWFTYKIMGPENIFVLYSDFLGVRIQHNGIFIRLKLPYNMNKGHCHEISEQSTSEKTTIV